MPAFTLLNTRPKHQAETLSTLVKEAGGLALDCPAIGIQLEAMPKQHSDLKSFDKVIFISVNAVNAFIEHGFKVPESQQACLRYFVIGKATFNAAKKAGLMVETNTGQDLGETFDSESLLKDPELQRVTQQKILIVKGYEGRDLLAQTFKQRGAIVEEWPLYRRKSLPLCLKAWQAFQQACHPIALATSVSSLESLIQAVKLASGLGQTDTRSGLDFLLTKPLVVFSQRIKTSAEQLGWLGDIAVVTTQSDQAVIDCIIESQWDK